MNKINPDNLFIAVYPTGLAYADKSREEYNDYKRLAWLPYGDLVLYFTKGCEQEWRVIISNHAKEIQDKRGQEFQISTAGQTITLGTTLTNQRGVK